MRRWMILQRALNEVRVTGAACICVLVRWRRGWAHLNRGGQRRRRRSRPLKSAPEVARARMNLSHVLIKLLIECSGGASCLGRRGAILIQQVIEQTWEVAAMFMYETCHLLKTVRGMQLEDACHDLADALAPH